MREVYIKICTFVVYLLLVGVEMKRRNSYPYVQTTLCDFQTYCMTCSYNPWLKSWAYIPSPYEFSCTCISIKVVETWEKNLCPTFWKNREKEFYVGLRLGFQTESGTFLPTEYQSSTWLGHKFTPAPVYCMLLICGIYFTIFLPDTDRVCICVHYIGSWASQGQFGHFSSLYMNFIQGKNLFCFVAGPGLIYYTICLYVPVN